MAVKRSACRADITTFMCRLSRELEASTSWKPLGITIIFIYCNFVVTQWQWLFHMFTKYEIGY